MRRLPTKLSVLAVLAFAVGGVGCERFGGSQSDPTCKEVVAHTDKLAIEYARSQSQEKGEQLEKLMEQAVTEDGIDEAVEMCREKLGDDQKRCIMRAETLAEKNACLGLRAGP